MTAATRSVKHEQRLLAEQLRAARKTWGEVAAAFVDKYNVNIRVAYRLAHGWSQREAIERWNERWPADPKTAKNLSYWEQWPGDTGYAPSLDVLAKLAELYECSAADLLSDHADFRPADVAHRDRTLRLDQPDILDRVESVDVHELSRIAATWTERVGSNLNRRALLLKLSAALSLAAASPALAADHDAVPMGGTANGDFAGIWLSRYHYTSTGRSQSLAGEHYVVMRHQGSGLTAQSVPSANGSLLQLDLLLSGTVATGTWSERTSPTGYYRGSTYHGALQLIVDPMGKRMSGRWVGFDREFNVNTDVWDLQWIEDATTAQARRKYHLKA